MGSKLKFLTLTGRRKWILAAALAVLVVSISTLVAAAFYYQDRALPGAKVAGQSVSGKTLTQISKLVQERADQAAVNFEVADKHKTLKLADLGVSVDAQATAKQVLAPNRSVVSRLLSVFKSLPVTPVYKLDENAFTTATNSLSELVGVAGKDATVTFKADADDFEVTPAEPGKVVDQEQLRSITEASAKSLKSASETLKVVERTPRVTTEKAQEALVAVKAFLTPQIDISDGEQTYQPSVADRAKWLSIDAAKGGAGVSVKADAVTSWVEKLGESTNVEMQPGVRNVNQRGQVVSTPDPGVAGMKVNNADQIAKEVLAAVSAKKAYQGKFEYDVTKPEFNDRLIADGSEKLIYQAAPGEKWIDVNLSNNTVTAYEGATVVHGPMGIVPGAPGMETVTGKFSIYSKVPSQTLRGTNPDGSKYEAPGVPWIMYFHGDYALHGAPWRSNFGWSGPGGSHGCVNMPVAGAQWLYNWASIGTPVISHY